ncbi:hypothetical protein AB6A40_007225 [Gnathostoma spinigerum]|uniref:ShKT domain-containing protein n=1 Tax=Gnathostoma spinigerum TaxID=75299 RepID=A0ABD6ESS8_9BILA
MHSLCFVFVLLITASHQAPLEEDESEVVPTLMAEEEKPESVASKSAIQSPPDESHIPDFPDEEAEGKGPEEPEPTKQKPQDLEPAEPIPAPPEVRLPTAEPPKREISEPVTTPKTQLPPVKPITAAELMENAAIAEAMNATDVELLKPEPARPQESVKIVGNETGLVGESGEEDSEFCNEADPGRDSKCCDLRMYCPHVTKYCYQDDLQLWYFCPRSCKFCKAGVQWTRPSRYSHYVRSHPGLFRQSLLLNKFRA